MLALARLETSWSDISEATGEPAKILKEVLDQRPPNPPQVDADATPAAEVGPAQDGDEPTDREATPPPPDTGSEQLSRHVAGIE